MSGNSVDPDQMLQNAASDLGLHCLLMSVNPKTCVNLVLTEDFYKIL